MKKRLRDNPPPVTEANAIHIDVHDPCYPCTRCRRAVRMMTEKQITGMAPANRAAIIRELVPTVEGSMRVSEFHLQGILKHLLIGVDLPAELDRKTLRVADLLAHMDAILAAMDPSIRDEDVEPGFVASLPASCQHRAPLPVSGALSAK